MNIDNEMPVVDMVDTTPYCAVNLPELASGSTSTETALRAGEMRQYEERDAILDNSTTDSSRDEWRQTGDFNYGFADDYLSHFEACRSSTPVQRDAHDLVLVPSGLRDRHAIPPCIAARNALVTSSQRPSPGTDSDVEHLEVLSRVPAHVECIEELDDADSVAVGAVDVKAGLWTWTTRASAFMRRKKSTSKKSGVMAADDKEAPKEPRKRSIFSGSIFGEKIVQPVKDTAQSTKSHKRKASRALSDFGDSIAESARNMTDRLLRRDSGYASKSPDNRRKRSDDRTEKKRARNYPYERACPRQDEEFATASNSPHYSFATASTGGRAAAMEEMQPLVQCRKPLPGARTEREGRGRAMPVTLLAHTANTPPDEMTLAQAQARVARAILTLAEQLQLQVNDGRCASGTVERRFEERYQFVSSGAKHQQSAASEFLANVAGEKRDMTRDHQAAMEEWERKGRPVVQSWM